MSDARRYAIWPDPKSRSRSRAYSRIKDRKFPIKGSRPSVPHGTNFLLLLSCAKSHMLSASRRQPHLLHVSALDRRQTWSMDKSWRCVTLSGFLHNHIVRCRWNPISCGTHYSGPGLSENDSAITNNMLIKVQL